jgi:uncharacterized UBP type Zn finger protein
MGGYDAPRRCVHQHNVQSLGFAEAASEGEHESQVRSSIVSFFCRLLTLIRRMVHRPVLGVLGKKYEQYLDFAQQDAHEFMRILLDAMRMEELDVRTLFVISVFTLIYTLSQCR